MDTRERSIVNHFVARLELTVGWLELDALINEAVVPMENAKTGVWTARYWKAARNTKRPISVMAHNCLATARKERDTLVVSVGAIQDAKDMVRSAMHVYHPAVFA
jgi:hypothetical protein